LWKEQNCRICASDPARPFWHKHRDSRRARRMRCSVSEPIVAGPNCGKVVYKPDGCDKMICGRDADDKGGGNKQVGTSTIGTENVARRSALMRPCIPTWRCAPISIRAAGLRALTAVVVRWCVGSLVPRPRHVAGESAAAAGWLLQSIPVDRSERIPAWRRRALCAQVASGSGPATRQGHQASHIERFGDCAEPTA
jgi:hypothetical protein